MGLTALKQKKHLQGLVENLAPLIKSSIFLYKHTHTPTNRSFLKNSMANTLVTEILLPVLHLLQDAAFLRTVSVVTMERGGPKITSLLMENTALSVAPAGLEEIAWVSFLNPLW